MKTNPSFDIIGEGRDQVGESPIWDEDTQTLYWVDIIGKKIRSHDTVSGKSASWSTSDFPTAIAMTRDNDRAVLAIAEGIAKFRFSDQNMEILSKPDPTSGNRLNEGKCDPQGRFWVGSMQNNLHPNGTGRDMDRNSGALFCYGRDGKVSRHSDFEFGISNTMAWSPDERTFYFGDSIRNVIFAYDYDAADAVISNRRVLIEGYPVGAPDGSSIDADGCLWNARFGGSRVIRIAPNGKVDREIHLPVRNPTSCTFGGSDYSKLFITSATFTLSEEQLSRNNLEGALLALDTDTFGVGDYKYEGTL